MGCLQNQLPRTCRALGAVQAPSASSVPNMEPSACSYDALASESEYESLYTGSQKSMRMRTKAWQLVDELNATLVELDTELKGASS